MLVAHTVIGHTAAVNGVYRVRGRGQQAYAILPSKAHSDHVLRGCRRRGEPRERMNEDHTLEEESPTQLGFTLLYNTLALVMFILLVTESLE